MSVYNFLVSGPKFTNLLSSNRGGNVVDQVFFALLIFVGDGRHSSRLTNARHKQGRGSPKKF